MLPLLTIGQVGINTTTPQATLDVREVDPANPTAAAGIAIPQVDVLPAAGSRGGQLVFRTTDNRYYYFDGTAWQPLLVRGNLAVTTVNASRALTPADNQAILLVDNAADVTLTVPTGLPTGFSVTVIQIGAGKAIFAPGAGATIQNRLSRFRTAGQNATAGLVVINGTTSYTIGDLVRN